MEISINKNEFKEELKEIKILNIHINEILTIYDRLTKNKEKNE